MLRFTVDLFGLGHVMTRSFVLIRSLCHLTQPNIELIRGAQALKDTPVVIVSLAHWLILRTILTLLNIVVHMTI